MDFRNEKMVIFLLICESLQLSVRAKKNALDRLCLWIENVKIGEEEKKQQPEVRTRQIQFFAWMFRTTFFARSRRFRSDTSGFLEETFLSET